MSKYFKNQFTIRAKSFELILLVMKFSLIANIFELNKNKNY